LEASPKEQWYAHYDGDNQGPMDLLRMMALIDSGRVRGETMVWKLGTPSWVEARTAFPGCFRGQKESVESEEKDSSDGKIDLERLGALVKAPKVWILFLAILGIVSCCILIPLTTLGLIARISTQGGGPIKAVTATWYLVNIFILIAKLVAFGYLLRLGNLIGVLRYRLTANDIEATINAANRFWKLFGITLAIAVVFEISMYFALSALGVSFLSGLIPSISKP
jgi:hypothetical protein